MGCPHHCGYTVSVPCIGLRRSEGSRRTHLLSPNKLFCQALQPDNSSRRPKQRLDGRPRTYNAKGMKSPYLSQNACCTRTAVHVVQVPFGFLLSSSNESMLKRLHNIYIEVIKIKISTVESQKKKKTPLKTKKKKKKKKKS